MTSPTAAKRSTPGSLTLLGVMWGFIAFALAFPYQFRSWVEHTVMDGGASSTSTRYADHPRSWAAFGITTALCAGIAPLVARRFPRAAGFLSLAPLLPLAIESPGINLSIACIPSLIGVASVVLYRNLWMGWFIGGVALLIPFIFAFISRSALWVTQSIIVSSSGANFGKKIAMFALYSGGIVLSLGTATAVSLYAHRREERRLVELRATELETRSALARDLHDVVAHRMSLVAVRAETAPYSVGDLSPQARQAFTDIAVEARGALDEMRTVLGVLERSSTTQKPQRAPQPQAQDIPHLVASAQKAGALVELEGSIPNLDALTGTTAYRVVQEALTNARRHEPREKATVHIAREGKAVTVRISNPTHAEDFERGRGVTGMRERVEQSGGTFRATNEQGKFVIEAVLPDHSSDQ